MCVCVARQPSYGILGAFLFIQTSCGFGLLGDFLDQGGRARLTMDLLTITLAPFVTACLTLLYFRHILDKVWDVTLAIRYCEQKAKQNETLLSNVLFRRFYAWYIYRCVKCGKVDAAKILADLEQEKLANKDLERERRIAEMMRLEREEMNKN